MEAELDRLTATIDSCVSFLEGLKSGLHSEVKKLASEKEELQALSTHVQKETEDLLAAKERFDRERKFIAQVSATASDIVRLNVGGRKFTTSLHTLTSIHDTMLCAMFSGRHNLPKDDSGRIFIDRDPNLFQYVLDFLRDHKLRLPSDPVVRTMLLDEFDYFCININPNITLKMWLLGEPLSTAEKVTELKRTSTQRIDFAACISSGWIPAKIIKLIYPYPCDRDRVLVPQVLFKWQLRLEYPPTREVFAYDLSHLCSDSKSTLFMDDIVTIPAGSEISAGSFLRTEHRSPLFVSAGLDTIVTSSEMSSGKKLASLFTSSQSSITFDAYLVYSCRTNREGFCTGEFKSNKVKVTIAHKK